MIAKKMTIYLIGYRCCGKTTLGKKLAAFLNVPFSDTDEMIQQQANMSIAQIVDRHGWEIFRKMETRVLKKTLQMDSYVISTGGGIVLDRQNRQLMKANGICVWLTADVNIIVERLKTDEHSSALRPALTRLSLKEETARVLKARLPLYREIQHLTIDTGICSPDDSIRAINRSLKNVRI